MAYFLVRKTPNKQFLFDSWHSKEEYVKNWTNKAIFPIALWHCFSLPAWGKNIEEEQPKELAPIIVSDEAETTEEPISSRFYLPESVEAVETLTKEDIQAIRPRDVSDLIETTLGMSIRRQGARVHNFSFSRGDSVSVILDGVYLTATEARRIIGDIPVEMIDSIKFVRDASVITIGPLMSFGSASGGSPNQGFTIIETRKKGPDSPYGAEVRSSYASYDTWKSSAFTAHSWMDDRFTLSAGYQRSQSQGKDDWNNGYTGNTWLMNGGFNSEGFQASGSLYYNAASREIQRAIGSYSGSTNYPISGPTPAGVLDKNIWEYDPIDTVLFAINLNRSWNAQHNTSLTYGWNRTEATLYAYNTLTDKSTVAGRDAEDRSEEWNLAHAITTQQNTLKIGGQIVSWLQRSEGRTTPREERIYGIYATDIYAFNPTWSVDAAMRVDKKKIVQGGDKYLSSGTEVQLSDGEWTDEAYVVSLGNAWQIDPVWRVTARYSFNLTPTPDFLTTVDDATLPDEQRHRYEVGIEANWSNAFQMTLTPFYYAIKNAKVADVTITTDTAGNPIIDPTTGEATSLTVYRADNRQRFGFEMNIRGHLLRDQLGYELGWTHFVDSNEDGIDGNEFPENKYSARLNWRHGDWESHATVLYVSPYLSYGYTVGDFTTINLSFSKNFSEKLTMAVFGQNITDEQYGTNNKGYPTTANWGVLRDVGATYGIELVYRF